MYEQLKHAELDVSPDSKYACGRPQCTSSSPPRIRLNHFTRDDMRQSKRSPRESCKRERLPSGSGVVSVTTIHVGYESTGRLSAS